MDFMERVFHMSPDHGSGAFEACIFLVIFLIPLAVTISRTSRKRRAERVANELQR